MIKKIALTLLLAISLLLSRTQAKQPKLILLSIGVNHYAVNEHREDVYANEARYLVNKIETHCDTVYTVEKKCLYSEEATREACLEALEWAAENSNEGDLTVVYIGTHGGGSKNGEFVFYPATDKVTSVEIISKIGNMKSNLLLLVDSCHSGAIIIDWKNPNDNVSIIASCKPEQGSYVWKFVKPFGEALDSADYNDDKTIDLVELGQYLEKRGGSEKQKPVSFGKSRKIFCEVDKKFILPHEEGTLCYQMFLENQLNQQVSQSIRWQRNLELPNPFFLGLCPRRGESPLRLLRNCPPIWV